MPRYFFDVHDGGSFYDEAGVEIATIDSVRTHTRRLLPDVAREELKAEGDRRTITVLVTDEDGRPVYTATLNYTGLWLLR